MKLQLPIMRGMIARRLLVNFRVQPDTAGKLLPPPFRPKLVAGWAMAGICLIRLERMRPGFMPARLGFSSENAAHRIAVQWEDNGAAREGVFIPRRDTNSRLNEAAGGWLFPGVHHAATFDVTEEKGRIDLTMRSREDETFVRVTAHSTDLWPTESVFPSKADASEFFRTGACGWSPRGQGDGFDGLELRTAGWSVTPLKVERVESSFFGDEGLFPRGSVEYDCALLMRGIPHEWHALGAAHSDEGRPCTR